MAISMYLLRSQRKTNDKNKSYVLCSCAKKDPFQQSVISLFLCPNISVMHCDHLPQTTTQLEAVWRVSSPWILWKPQLKKLFIAPLATFRTENVSKTSSLLLRLWTNRKIRDLPAKMEEFPYGSKGLKWWTMVGKIKHPPGRTQRNCRSFPPHRWWLLALSPAGWPR